MAENDSKLVKLKMIGYSDKEYKKKVSDNTEFIVMFNPSTIKQTFNIHYNEEQPPNATTPENKYDKTGPEKLSFEIILDGSGAAANKVEVKDEIDRLKETAYNFQGEHHETPYVSLFWGSWYFDGRLTSMDIDYTMFKPNGDPLRAKISMSFVGAMGSETESRKRGLSSPDLSHLRTVYEGDTLPLMCERIYGDSSMYLKVAQVNNLVNFRYLEPGTEILFPPIK